MTIYCQYPTPRKTCHAVQEEVKSHFGKLSPRPWNMYEPETTLWWLVPSTAWPAYKYGKLYFNWANVDRTGLWVGFHCEKGLAPSISSVYASAKGSKLMMQDDWQWPALLRQLESGKLAQAVTATAPGLPVPIQIRIKGGYVDDPTDFDPYAASYKEDDYVLEWNAAAAKFVVKLAQPEGHVLGELAQVNSFERLARELKLITSNAWVWVNLYFVMPLAIQPAPTSGAVTSWGAPEIWSNFVQPFRRFFL